MVVGHTQQDDPDLAAWIRESLVRRGLVGGRATTEWVELGSESQRIYHSQRGGRQVDLSVHPGAAPNQLVITIEGRKIDAPAETSLAAQPGARELIPLTDYPSGENLFLALKVEERR